jgi:Glutathione-dependent formaldehyde-activating enzyme
MIHGLACQCAISLLSPSKLRSCYPGDIFDLVPTSSFVGGLRRRQLNIAAPVTAKWWHAAGTQPLHAKVAGRFLLPANSRIGMPPRSMQLGIEPLVDRQPAPPCARSHPISIRQATCSCRQLTLTIEGEPARIAMCHCLECQRRTGALISNQARFRREQITIAGKPTGGRARLRVATRSPSTSARPAAPRSTGRAKAFPDMPQSPSAPSRTRIFPRLRSRTGKSPATPGSFFRPARHRKRAPKQG